MASSLLVFYHCHLWGLQWERSLVTALSTPRFLSVDICMGYTVIQFVNPGVQLCLGVDREDLPGSQVPANQTRAPVPVSVGSALGSRAEDLSGRSPGTRRPQLLLPTQAIRLSDTSADHCSPAQFIESLNQTVYINRGWSGTHKPMQTSNIGQWN